MSAILAFLMGRPAWIAGALVLALLGGVGIQTARLDHAKADQLDPSSRKPWKDEYRAQQTALLAAEADLGTCRANQSTLQQSIDRQNDAVAQIKGEADARTHSADAAIAAARAGNGKLDQMLSALKGARPQGSDLCASADDLIRSFAR